MPRNQGSGGHAVDSVDRLQPKVAVGMVLKALWSNPSRVTRGGSRNSVCTVGTCVGRRLVKVTIYLRESTEGNAVMNGYNAFFRDDRQLQNQSVTFSPVLLLVLLQTELRVASEKFTPVACTVYERGFLGDFLVSV